MSSQFNKLVYQKKAFLRPLVLTLLSSVVKFTSMINKRCTSAFLNAVYDNEYSLSTCRPLQKQSAFVDDLFTFTDATKEFNFRIDIGCIGKWVPSYTN